jgi:hypothetical protein
MSDIMLFLNSNGLVDGRIPAGKPCPFASDCTVYNERCPSKENDNMRTVPMSCAIARAFSITKSPTEPKEEKSVISSIFDGVSKLIKDDDD